MLLGFFLLLLLLHYEEHWLRGPDLEHKTGCELYIYIGGGGTKLLRQLGSPNPSLRSLYLAFLAYGEIVQFLILVSLVPQKSRGEESIFFEYAGGRIPC